MTYKSHADAGDLILGAARIRAEAEFWNGKHPVAGDLKRADKLETRVREILPERLSEIGAGGELAPHESAGGSAVKFRSTVQKPDYVTAAASRNRLDLAHQAGVLESALDTADTIDAGNSIEQMLAHQLAAAHHSAMQLTAQLNRQIERMKVLHDDKRQAANVEAARTTNAMARLMQTFQQGTVTLHRLRTGGRQVVTVQHVNVGAGGKAIVAGEIGSGGHAGNNGKGRSKNEQ